MQLAAIAPAPTIPAPKAATPPLTAAAAPTRAEPLPRLILLTVAASSRAIAGDASVVDDESNAKSVYMVGRRRSPPT